MDKKVIFLLHLLCSRNPNEWVEFIDFFVRSLSFVLYEFHCIIQIYLAPLYIL